MGTAGDWAKRVGRAVAWLAVFIVIVSGLVNLATSPSNNQASGSEPKQAPWPDDEARAFAVGFARAYYDYDPKHPGYYERTITAYVDNNVATRIVPTWPDNAPRSSALEATVARTTRLDAQHALITVAVAVNVDNKTSTRYLAVPVAHDKSGGLVVNGLPGMTSAPLLGASSNQDTDSLSSAEGDAIGDLLNRFFEAYLAGDASAVAAGPALPGVQLGASPVRLVFGSVESVGLVKPPSGVTREVLVIVDASEPFGETKEEEVSYQLSYRLRLTKGDRWYVAQINGTK